MRRIELVLLAALALAAVPGLRAQEAGPAKEIKPPEGKPAAAAKAPQGNPAHADPAQELMRLRLEGLANYEGGVTLKSALALFEKALALKPESPIEMLNLGIVQRKLDHFDQARILLGKVMTAAPGMPQAPYVLGLIEKAQGNQDAALKLFEKARDLAPQEPSVWYQLSFLYKAADREADALQALTRVLALDPFHSGATYQLYQHHRRVGDEERAAEVFKEFSRLKRAAGASRKEVNYDEGPLTLPVVDAQAEANVASHGSWSPSLAQARLAAPAGVAAFEWRDVDADGREDLTVVHEGGVSVLVNQGGGGFAAPRALALGEGVSGPWSSVAVEAFSSKSGPHVLLGGPGGLSFGALDLANGKLDAQRLAEGESRPLLLQDLDHDGDLDLLAGKERTLWANRGNADLFADNELLLPEVRQALVSAAGVVAAAFANGDGVDLLLWDAKGERRFVRDSMGGRYELVEKRPAARPGLVWTAAADLDGDGSPDVVSLASGQLSVELNRGGFQLEEAFTAPVGGDGGSGAILDLDNDGLRDLAVLRPGAAPAVWLNEGKGRFLGRTLAGTVPELLQGPVAADVDADGRLDLLALAKDGPVWWHNQSEGVGNWLKLRLKGVRSVPFGGFTRVETRIGNRYQEVEADGRTVHLGIGRSPYVEVLRITWPNGFVENKFKVDAGNTWSFVESERISGSCPTVFAWNGERFGFVTDAFISGPMGVPMARGRYFPVDHDEYIKIAGDQLQNRDGLYQIRITEELRETVYLDTLRLLVVDHPAEVTLFPNERLGPFPFPEFRLHGTTGLEAPLAAEDASGRDVLELIRATDGRYPNDVVRTEYTGIARPHWIELDLPSRALESEHLRLFLNGWFYYFDSTSLIALSQRTDLGIGWPEVQAWAGGEWRTVAVAGLPQGKHKTVVVDLSGKLPEGTARLRVWSNVSVYWDSILFDAGRPWEGEVRIAEAPLDRSWLQFRGFSALVDPVDPAVPERFDYHRVVYTALWNPMAGKYTRYGAVEPLLAAADSRLVVFGSGDELALDFDASAIPEPPPGWSRDFLLYLDGFVKDGDRYTAHAGRVEPMPFAGMREYPYSAADQAAAPSREESWREYLETYQIRDPLTFVGPPLAGAPPVAVQKGWEP